MKQPSQAELEKLGDTDLILARDDQDVRGRKVVDPHGDQIGHVSNLFVDDVHCKVRLLEIRSGGFFRVGQTHGLIPVEAITRVTPDTIVISATRDHVAHSPAYDPELVKAPDQPYWEPFYGYYGLSPYWNSGYLYPDFPLALERRTAIEQPAVPASER